MTRTDLPPEQRRRVLRTAWLLAALVAFMFVTSFPFWKGLYQLAVNGP